MRMGLWGQNFRANLRLKSRVISAWRLFVKRRSLRLREGALQLSVAFDKIDRRLMTRALDTFAQNINYTCNVFKLANVLQTMLKKKKRQVFEFVLRPNVFHKLVRPLRDIRRLFDKLHSDFNHQFAKYSHKQLYIRNSRYAEMIEQKFNQVHNIAIKMPIALTNVAKAALKADDLRFRMLKKCYIDGKDRKYKARTYVRRSVMRAFNKLRKLVPSEIESQLRRNKYACARHQEILQGRYFRLMDKIVVDNRIRNNFTKWRLEMQKQLAFNRIESEYHGKHKKQTSSLKEKRTAAASFLCSILLQRQLQNRFRHELRGQPGQTYFPFKSYESVSENRIRYSSAVISPQKKIEGPLFWGSPVPRSSNRSTECTNSAIAHYSNFSTEERQSPQRSTILRCIKIVNHFFQTWKLESFSIESGFNKQHGAMSIKNILARFLRQKIVNAFVTIQLNGYHRVVNKKVEDSKIDLKALVKHIKLKTMESNQPLTKTESLMLKMIRKSLFRPLNVKARIFGFFQKWRYACDQRMEQDSALSSSHTLIRSGFGKKWENPLTVRHFEHQSRSVSCIILAQIFSMKRLSSENYKNGLIKSNALRAWKRRVKQEQIFQNDGEMILTSTHYRALKTMKSVFMSYYAYKRMKGFDRWRDNTLALQSEQAHRRQKRDQLAQQLENDVLAVQAKVNYKLEADLGVLNSVYLELSQHQVNLEVAIRLERALGHGIRRVWEEGFKTIAEHKLEEFKSKKEFQQVMLCLDQETEILDAEYQNSQDINFDLHNQIGMLLNPDYNCEECVLMRKRINMNHGDEQLYFMEAFSRQITDNSEEENELIISSHSNTGRKNLLMIDVDSSSNQADRHPKTSGAVHNRPMKSSKGRFTPYDPFCNLPTMSSSTSSYQKHAQMQFSPSTKNTSLTKGIRSERRSEMEVLSEQKQMQEEEEEKIVAIAEESNSEGVGNSNEVTQRNELGDEYVKWLKSKSNFYYEMLKLSDEEFLQREETDDQLRALQFQVAQLENERKQGGLF